MALAAVGAAVVLWFVLKPEDEPGSAPEETGGATPAQVAAPAPAAAPAPPPPPQPSAAPRPTPLSPEDPRIVGPHPDDPHEPGMLPHPLDEAHKRLYAENNLIQRLNDAMASRDVKAMREMIAEYRKLDPADVEANQAGYTVIAECIAHPGEASLAAAHQFYDTQRHSQLRRFVRRICFENTN